MDVRAEIRFVVKSLEGRLPPGILERLSELDSLDYLEIDGVKIYGNKVDSDFHHKRGDQTLYVFLSSGEPLPEWLEGALYQVVICLKLEGSLDIDLQVRSSGLHYPTDSPCTEVSISSLSLELAQQAAGFIEALRDSRTIQNKPT